MQFLDYVKTAFVNRWNLLAVAAGTAFGVISGRPDVVLPVVAALELGYLGMLVGNPKFQRHVQAQQAKAARTEAEQSSQEALQHILRSLPRKSLERFETLRQQCRDLRHLAHQLRTPSRQSPEQWLDESQLAGIDRLLWLFLRMLYTHFALGQFLERTNPRRIEQDIASIQQRLNQLSPNQDHVQAQRLRQTLEENLATSQARLANWFKARDNFQLVEVQLEHLENKIRSLSEMAINRQEPDFISSEVNQVTASMLDTERTMNELQVATGLSGLTDESPPLLRAEIAEMEQ